MFPRSVRCVRRAEEVFVPEISPRRGGVLQLLYSGMIFFSAALLFWVEPLLGKMVLPLLGGSPAVWNTCLEFFQAALLLGYLYAHLRCLLIGWFWPGIPRIWLHSLTINGTQLFRRLQRDVHGLTIILICSHASRSAYLLVMCHAFSRR
jgi:hypothetical protein